jgi:hypothetical protein
MEELPPHIWDRPGAYFKYDNENDGVTRTFLVESIQTEIRWAGIRCTHCQDALINNSERGVFSYKNHICE